VPKISGNLDPADLEFVYRIVVCGLEGLAQDVMLEHRWFARWEANESLGVEVGDPTPECQYEQDQQGGA
jgi:hypothetical protein